MHDVADHHHAALNRRSFLAAGLAATGAAALASGATSRAGARALLPATANDRGRAKNIIFLVADGMSSGTLQLADTIGPSLPRFAHGSKWIELHQHAGAHGRGSATDNPIGGTGVYRSLQMTHSRNALVTDSAAAGSAWGSGVHIDNGSINFLPERDATQPVPLFTTLADSDVRKATGLVTTTRVTHATPAAFVAAVPSRGMEGEVAQQILDRGVDIVLGGGRRLFTDDMLAKHDDIMLCETRDQMNAAADHDGRILGLFQREHCSFEIDRHHLTADTEPTLAEMSRFAIEQLAKRSEGFVLQIEGGRIDHAAHGNDAPSLIWDQLAFEEAIAEAVEFAADRDDTLVIITTDHANANPGLTLYGPDGTNRFNTLRRATRSQSWVTDQIDGSADPEEQAETFAELVKQATAVELSEADREWVKRVLVDKEPGDAFVAAGGFASLYGAVLANHSGVAFLSPNHTADYVETTAFGPGAERLGPLIDNIDLHTLMIEMLGVSAT
ncbi:MAG: alkaline phosphatase [Planctomycetota bacterium]